MGTQWTVRQWWHKIFGKNISSSMLRKIYLSSKYSNLKEDLENESLAMGTSTSTVQNHYIKEDW